MGKVLVLLLGLSALAFPQGGADPIPGTYSNADVRVELRPAAQLQYAGAITVQGQTFPLRAALGQQGLNGSFTANGQAYAFTAQVEGNRMRLVSDGTEYQLTRQGAAAPVPLGVRNTAAGPAHEHPRGFRLRPAAGWRAQNNDQGVVLTPPNAAPNNQEIYVAAVQEGYSPAEEANAVRQISQNFLQNGGQAGRAGVREAFAGGASYYWEAHDPNSGQMAGLKIYFAPAGNRAHMIVAVGQAAYLRQREGDVRAMLASFAADAPKPIAAGGPLADNTPLAQQWLQKLRGRMIRQMYAYQGMSSDKRHYLNADGTYAFRSSSMVSVDVGGASGLSTGRGNQRGRWRLRDIGGAVFLQIQYDDGGTGEYRITQDARNWYLNGEKAFAVDPE
jgi:hypothetical protein